MRMPPTAPTIIPVKAPVDKPPFELVLVDEPAAAPVEEVGGIVIVATYVVPVGVDT